MITYRSRFLSRGEVWFDNEPDDSRAVDWIIYHQRSRPVPGAKSRFFYTYVIDLTRSYEQLQANLNRDTAYKIRRARERDKINCECLDPNNPEHMNGFEQMYNSFAAIKGLQTLERARMESMAAEGVLDLSVAKDAQDNVLVYHANYRDGTRAAGVELPSLYRANSDSSVRNLIGRANRFLTWSEILRYKEQGLKCFDFGGWYHGTDPGMLHINDFKKGFGGEVVREYECEQILTLKGWAVLAAAAALKCVRRANTRLQPASTRHEPETTKPGALSASTRARAAEPKLVLHESELAK